MVKPIRTEALFVGGRAGVGKSSVAGEMDTQLSAAGIAGPSAAGPA